MKISVHEIGTIKDINDRQDLQFVSDSQDVNSIKEYLGITKTTIFDNLFDSFFVRIENGDYAEIYGIQGIIPNLSKSLYKINVEY